MTSVIAEADLQISILNFKKLHYKRRFPRIYLVDRHFPSNHTRKSCWSDWKFLLFDLFSKENKVSYAHQQVAHLQ